MNKNSISEVHFQDEVSLWSYCNNCGLSPVLKLLDNGPLDYKKVTYSLGEIFICSTKSFSGGGVEKQHNTDVYFITYTHTGNSIWEMNKHGRIEAHQQLCIIDSSELVQGRFTPETYTDIIMIDARTLTRELELLQGVDCEDRLEFQPLLSNRSPAWSMINLVINCIKGATLLHQAHNSPLAITYLKQALISTITDFAPHNYTNNKQLKREHLTPRHVTRAIEYLHAHVSEDISISDAAAYACTSVRNLQLGFRTFKNMSPMQYLRNLRLKGAHQEIIQEEIPLSWQQIATKWGFTDHCLFSKYYKDKYGRTPFQVQHKVKGKLKPDSTKT